MNLRLAGIKKCGWRFPALLLGLLPVIVHAAVPTPGANDGNASDDAANPYSVIVDRNIFHLTSPPPPPEPDKPKVELPVIKITGFLNTGGRTKVLFVSEPKDKKDQHYYSLTEGEKSSDGKLQLVKIHTAQDAVDVVNDGTETTLTVKSDSLAPNISVPGAGPSSVANPPSFRPGGPPYPGAGIPGRQIFPGRPGQPGVPGFSFPARGRVSLP